MGKLPHFTDSNLLVDFASSDDAAVYRISEHTALIQTVDFFTPVVDDPRLFGEIAAANALSDVYAMGGVPTVALNIVGFPDCLPPSILEEIMAGGAEKVREAGAVLAGGHSIRTEEPLYGLCVTGFVHPEKIWTNGGARPGDALILTKQIGSGLVNTAVKGDLASPEAAAEAALVMRTLNRGAKEALEVLHVHGCTDITGFGLGGHATELARGSGVTLLLDPEAVPLMEGAAEYAEMGLVPAGTYRNRECFQRDMDIRTYFAQNTGGDDIQDTDPGAADLTLDLLFDPQTSGGLLCALPVEEAAEALERLARLSPETKCAVVGRVEAYSGASIRLARGVLPD